MMADYIDRQAVMAELEKEVELADDWKTAHEIANVVKYFPSADAQPVRHGHWEKIGKPTWWGLYECSECHKTCSVDHTYCPHCGSIMKEKKND